MLPVRGKETIIIVRMDSNQDILLSSTIHRPQETRSCECNVKQLQLSQTKTYTSPDAFEPPQTAVAASCLDLESRWPGAEKMIRYRKAKLEKFALYKRPDGLVTRLTTFKDLKCEYESDTGRRYPLEITLSAPSVVLC